MSREEPGLTQLAFNRLLEWLDNGVGSNGEAYLEMRRRLVSYFDRRNRPAADDLADETLNRIGRTLEKDGAIATTPPARFCYTVAKFVLLEDLRREHKQRSRSERLWNGDVVTASRSLELEESLEMKEQRLECLDRSLGELHPDQRALVIEYYRDARRQKIERRRDIAKRLGITMNALSIRVSRIRTALEASVEICMEARRQRDRTSRRDNADVTEET